MCVQSRENSESAIPSHRDSWCFNEKKRWLRKGLQIPKASKMHSAEDAEEEPEDPVLALLDEAVDHFFTLLTHLNLQQPCNNVNALATCALYYFKTLYKKPKTEVTLLTPCFRLLANAAAKLGKSYFPGHACTDDVELAMNRLPKFWQDAVSAEQPSDQAGLHPHPNLMDVSKLAVASPQ